MGVSDRDEIAAGLEDERTSELHKLREVLGTCLNAPSVLAMQRERDNARRLLAYVLKAIEGGVLVHYRQDTTHHRVEFWGGFVDKIRDELRE